MRVYGPVKHASKIPTIQQTAGKCHLANHVHHILDTANRGKKASAPGGGELYKNTWMGREHHGDAEDTEKAGGFRGRHFEFHVCLRVLNPEP